MSEGSEDGVARGCLEPGMPAWVAFYEPGMIGSILFCLAEEA